MFHSFCIQLFSFFFFLSSSFCNKYYESNYVPLAVLRHQEIIVTNTRTGSYLVFGPIGKAPYQYSSFSLKFDYLNYTMADRCVSAFTSNIFSGHCELPSYCVSQHSFRVDHKWYGSSVSLCAGIDQKVASLVSSNSFSFDALDISFHYYERALKSHSVPFDYISHNNLVVIYNRKYHLIPFSMVSSMVSKDFIQNSAPVGNWHKVSYTKWSVEKLHEILHQITNNNARDRLNDIHYFEYIKLPDHFVYKFACGTFPNVIANISHNFYPHSSCFNIMQINATHSICANLYLNQQFSSFCPADLIPFPSNMYSKEIFIKSSTKGFFADTLNAFVEDLESLFERIVKISFKFIEPLFLILLKSLFNLLILGFKNLISLVIDSLPFVVQFLVLIVRVVIFLLFLLKILILQIDIHMHFVELFFISLLVMRYLSFQQYVLLLVLVLPFLPLHRLYPSLLLLTLDYHNFTDYNLTNPFDNITLESVPY